MRLNCYLKHLESSLIIDLGNEIHWSSLNLDLKSGTALSESHLSLLRYKSHSVMTPVILVGHVQPVWSGSICMNVLIDAKHFSMRHIILWAWQVLVGG